MVRLILIIDYIMNNDISQIKTLIENNNNLRKNILFDGCQSIRDLAIISCVLRHSRFPDESIVIERAMELQSCCCTSSMLPPGDVSVALKMTLTNS